jgi:hypothetical protein
MEKFSRFPGTLHHLIASTAPFPFSCPPLDNATMKKDRNERQLSTNEKFGAYSSW